MRELRRAIKRAFLDKMKPGNKPKSTAAGMKGVADLTGFKEWRKRLEKSGKEWRKKHGYEVV